MNTSASFVGLAAIGLNLCPSWRRRWAAVAVIGLLAVCSPASAAAEEIRSAPPRPIGELKPDLQGQTVTVRGSIVAVGEIDQGHVLTIEDDSGKVEVLLWKTVVQDLLRKTRPKIGWELTARGKVEVLGEKLRVVPGVPDLGEIEMLEQVPLPPQKPKVQPVLADRAVPIVSVTAERQGQTLLIRGKVDRVSDLSGKGRLAALADATGRISVVLWDSEVGDRLGRAALLPGALLQVEGRVRLYQGKPELVVYRDNAAQLRLTPPSGPDAPSPPTAAATVTATLAAIDETLVDRMVSTEAAIAAVRTIKGGRIFTLSQGNTTMPLVVWSRCDSQLSNPEALKPGARIAVKAKVQRYQGKLELMLVRGEHIEIR